jgi:spore coat protein H
VLAQVVIAGVHAGQRVIGVHVTPQRFEDGFPVMEELPGMISLRTQFVHLYVKDETVEGNSGFKDYGLFTQVEQPNKTFLRNHGFDSYGQLYKVNFFEFRQYEDVIKLKSDAGYDEKAFEELLEIKGDDDHSKLISMLADVNNYEKPIKEIFNEWFDEDNFFSWMAFHILTGNIDTQSRNTLLYSPLNINKWYFISWDNDASFMQFEQLLKDPLSEKGWEYGISNYWGNVLFQRVLKSSYYRQKLDEKIEEYRKIITEDKLTKMIAGYKEVTDYYRNHLPDIMNNRLTNENYEKVCKEMPKEIEENYQLYKQSLEAPMPFYIGTPQVKDNKLHFDWDVSYDYDMENINYTFELARDYTFKETVIKEDNLIIPETETDKLKPGQYFIRITSENESGYKQYAFDYYNTDNGKMYGVKCFYVLEDGSIEEDAYEE